MQNIVKIPDAFSEINKTDYSAFAYVNISHRRCT